MSADDFDPYRDWLGLARRPANHYELLGLPIFERDAAAIGAAADARMAEVRKHQTGPRGRWTHALLNEIAAARICLLNERAKTAYDAALVSPPTPPPAPPPVVSIAPSAPEAKPAPSSPHNEVEVVDTPGDALWWLPFAALFLLVIGIAAAGMVYAYRMAKDRALAAAEQETLKVRVSRAPSLTALPDVDEVDPSLLTQEGNGDVSFPLSVAERDGVSLADAGGVSRLAAWEEAGVARWRFRVVRPAIFQVRIVYSGQNSAGGEWRLRLGEEEKTRSISAGATPEAAVTDEFFWRITRGGEHVLELSASGLPPGQSLSLESLRFVHQDAGRVAPAP